MKKVTLVILAAMLAGCSTAAKKTAVTGACPPCPTGPAAPPTVQTTIPPGPETPVFADGDDLISLLKAAKLNQAYFKGLKSGALSYNFGDRKVTVKDLADTTDELIKILETSPTPQDLDRQIKQKFDVYQMAGRDSTGTVVFSSYYEPTLEASLKYDSTYKYPIYARPDDMVSINLEDFNEKFKGEKLTGRIVKNEMVPYMSREEIDFGGALEGKGLELAWFKKRSDIMDLHTEGSGRLALPDGRVIKAKFAATNSLKFKGWLTAMVEAGALPREGISPEKGQKYLDEHPDKVRPILSMNKRYVFFKLEQPADPEEGPAGTYGLPLTGWRSVAVDNALYPMGTLAFMKVDSAPDVDADGKLLGRRQDGRFVFCQDTGGAIKGPGRVDFFAGNGKKATTFAFKLWDPGQMYMLVLKAKEGSL